MFGRRTKAFALSWLLAGILFISPRAALRFISSFQPESVNPDAVGPGLMKQVKRQRKGSCQPMERERATVIRKADARRLSTDLHPADWERITRQPRLGGLPITGRLQLLTESRKPQYLRLFLSATPQSHRSPPSKPPSEA